MGLIFILHVLGVGIVLNRLPFRLWTLLGVFAYFLLFYLASGHYLRGHKAVYIPSPTLEDDYYYFYPKPKPSPFDVQEGDAQRKDRKRQEAEEEEREFRRRQLENASKIQPTTKP